MRMCLFCTFLATVVTDFCESVAVFQFQTNGNQSNSFLEWQGPYSNRFPLTSLTLCARFKFFSLWEVSGFVQLSDFSEDGTENPRMLQAEIDVKRVRASIGGFRRYHFLDYRLQALTWHHVCLTYSNETQEMTCFVNGKNKSKFTGPLAYPVTGTQFKVGAWNTKENFNGDISEVNLWSRVLSEDEISALGGCKSDIEGDIVPWTGFWKKFGDVKETDQNSSDFCREITENGFLLFPKMSIAKGVHVCDGLGGEIPCPESEDEVLAIINRSVSLISGRNKCEAFWVGASDADSESHWTSLRSGKKLSLFWKTGFPDGYTVKNCAVISLDGTYGVIDTPCYAEHCVFCSMPPKPPVWTVHGACERDEKNTQMVIVQERFGQLLFRGYSDYYIKEENKMWTWFDRRNRSAVAYLAFRNDADYGFPFGRKTWRLLRPVCDQKPSELITLLLSPCSPGMFTCNDATCVPLSQRCDLKIDCGDSSDEQNCRLVYFPLAYRKDIPPQIKENGTPLPVSVFAHLERVDISTPKMEMYVNFNLTMTWKDSRLSYYNLNSDTFLNRVRNETAQEMWVPTIEFTNTIGNHITRADEQAVMTLHKQGLPIQGDDSHAEESNVCYMEFTMLSAYSKIINFDEKSSGVIFEGNSNLVEFIIGDVVLGFKNIREHSVMLVKVQLYRRSGFIVMDVYIPSMCLLVISYMTLHFNPSMFQVKVLASLTSLLVMATLYTQASSHLPKTSYFKMVDVWLLSSILIIFVEIVFHTVIDRTLEEERSDLRSLTNCGNCLSKRASEQSHRSGNMGSRHQPLSNLIIFVSKAVMIVIIIVFNLAYWLYAMCSTN